MNYLKKSQDSKIIRQRWSYPKDARSIRAELVREQHGFCAYSERYIQNTDARDVEHFDPRLKGSAQDSYWNWYAVLHWMNQRKPRKIEDFEPVLDPYSTDLEQRIKYENGQFLAIDAEDKDTDNLIRYLGWNSPELAKDRRNHMKRIQFVQQMFGNDPIGFCNYLASNPVNLSFFSALKVEFDLPDALLERISEH